MATRNGSLDRVGCWYERLLEADLPSQYGSDGTEGDQASFRQSDSTAL